MRRARVGICLILCLLGLCFLVGAQAAQVKKVQFRKSAATMQVGSAAKGIATGNTLKITYRVLPSNAEGALTWSSSDETVATVADGVVTAHKIGRCKITAVSENGRRAALKLRVVGVPVKSVRLDAKSKTISLDDGNTCTLTATVAPAVATNQTVSWRSSNTKIATVANGVVTFKKAGKVVIRCQSANGKRALCVVRATAATRTESAAGVGRALVIGESRKSTVGLFSLAALPMVPEEVKGIASMFAVRKVGGKAIATKSLTNTTRAKALAAIQTTFQAAKETDTSFLYIICHGGVSGGNYLIFPCNDGYITAKQLRTALDKVKGRVVVMLGCCESGDVIGKSASFADGFADSFFETKTVAKSGELATGKYLVLTACKAGEYGYGIVPNTRGTAYNYGYNLFGYALAEGAGWDLLAQKSAAMSADANADGQLTLHELYTYASARVNALYKEWASDGVFDARESQTVQVYPVNSSAVLFSK